MLFVFWLVVFVLPIVSSKMFINAYSTEEARNIELSDRQALRREMEFFIADLDLGALIEKQTKQVEKNLQYEISNSSSTINPSLICGIARNLFEENAVCQPVLIAAYSPQDSQTEVLRLDPDYINPGRRSVEIILKYLNDSARGKASESQTRLYQQICGSLFGDLLQPGDQAGVLTSGFLSKGFGDRMFIYYNQLKTGKNKANSPFLLVMFAESKNGFRLLLSKARQRRENTALKRSYAMLQTFADRDYMRDRQNQLHYVAPLPPAVLRTGSHSRRDWYTSAISSGEALKKPGRLPFAVVSPAGERNKSGNISALDLANLALLAILFIGTALVQQIVTDRFAKTPINIKFALTILLSTTLPFAVLIVTAHKFAGHFNQTLVQNSLRNMSNDLYIVESNIHNHDQRQKLKISNFVAKLGSEVNQPADVLKEILDSSFGKLYCGYILFRNDATLIEKLPEESSITVDDRGKLMLMRDLTLAQVYSVFEHAGILSADFAKNIEKVPDFRRWRAYSVHYQPIDRNSSCMQDGEYFPVKMSERQFVRLSNHYLFPKTSAGKVWAGLTLLSDVRETAEDYLNKLPGLLFSNQERSLVTHTAVYRRNARKQIDMQKAWPQNALADKQMLQTANSLAADRNETSWFTTDVTGMISLFCARAVSDMPFVIAARTEIPVPAMLEGLLPILLLLAVLYLLLLIKLLSSVLTDIFLKPVNMMIQGLATIDQGNYPTIVDNSVNELGSLINDFNSMVEGMRQRRILERFISDEASQTISNNGFDGQSLSGSLVYRVVMFIHIRKFDEICEQIEPESVIRLLNIYFSTLEPEIAAHGGQIDKYIADAIMVSFARERTDNQPELAAAKTALRCLQRLPELNAALQSAGLPMIITGAGIAAGPVILGQIGAHRGRKDFTLIGDAVNLAARLESASHFGENPHILVAKPIEEMAANLLQLRFHDLLKVKGKQMAVEVFELEATS